MAFSGRERLSKLPIKDQFLLNPPLQPKAEVADYVESQGVSVPRRFANLQEALDSGKPFIIRSEHPQDYAGASGIGRSLVVTDEEMEKAFKRVERIGRDIDWDGFENSNRVHDYDIKDQIIVSLNETPQSIIEQRLTRLSRRQFNTYCQLMDVDLEEFEAQRTYSYWEHVTGFKQVIVADNAVSGRYHIFSYSNSPHEDMRFNYTVAEDGHPVISGPMEDWWLSPDLKLRNQIKNLSASIEFYEQVRNLPAFDEKHAPLIETVLDGENQYFLQYLRLKDYSEAGFTLDREPMPNEIEVDFVRGATSEEGIICETRFWYGFLIGEKAMLEDEDASFDFHWHLTFSELMAARRKAQFIPADNVNDMLLRTIDEHLQKSKLFKPGLSVLITDENYVQLLPELSRDERMSAEEAVNFRTKIKIISDGRRAFVSRVE